MRNLAAMAVLIVIAAVLMGVAWAIDHPKQSRPSNEWWEPGDFWASRKRQGRE